MLYKIAILSSWPKGAFEMSNPINCKKTLKFKIGVLWRTIAQKQQISGDFI
jgi:hypothetical protein